MVAVEEFPTDLVLGRIADEALCVRESHIGGRHSIALVVGDDLYSVVLPDAHTPAKRAPTSHRQRKGYTRPLLLPSHVKSTAACWRADAK